MACAECGLKRGHETTCSKRLRSIDTPVDGKDAKVNLDERPRAPVLVEASLEDLSTALTKAERALRLAKTRHGTTGKAVQEAQKDRDNVVEQIVAREERMKERREIPLESQ